MHTILRYFQVLISIPHNFLHSLRVDLATLRARAIAIPTPAQRRAAGSAIYRYVEGDRTLTDEDFNEAIVVLKISRRLLDAQISTATRIRRFERRHRHASI